MFIHYILRIKWFILFYTFIYYACICQVLQPTPAAVGAAGEREGASAHQQQADQQVKGRIPLASKFFLPTSNLFLTRSTPSWILDIH